MAKEQREIVARGLTSSNVGSEIRWDIAAEPDHGPIYDHGKLLKVKYDDDGVWITVEQVVYLFNNEKILVTDGPGREH